MSSKKTVSIAGSCFGGGEHYIQQVNEKSSLDRLYITEHQRRLTMDCSRVSYVMQYGVVCQRGYYPNALNKANQDSWTVCESVLGDKHCHLFGIFDGHGEVGDLCSHYAAVKVRVVIVVIFFR